MRAGGLDKRITIERRVRTRSPSSGELVDTWPEMGTVWAELMTAAAVERWVGKQEIAVSNVNFRARAMPALLTLTPDEHRLTYNAMTYNIRGVVEVQRRQGVIIMCEGRAEGVTGQGMPPT